MSTWIILITVSSLIGILIAIYIKNRFAHLLAAFIPWLIFLGVILYEVYFIPYKGGGTSMWPIAIIFGGTAAAFIGFIAFMLTKYFREYLQTNKKINKDT